MKNRIKIQEKDKKQNDDYETNLKLHLNIMQNELKIIISSSMQNQVNNIKTILWIDMLFMAMSMQLFSKVEINIYYLIVFYIPLISSTALLLVALLSKRHKYYGTVSSDYSSTIYNNKHQTMTMLAALLGTTEVAIAKNKSVMKYISRFMHIATWLTFLSLVISVVVFSIYIKGGNEQMADEKEAPVVPTEIIQPTQPIQESEERSSKK